MIKRQKERIQICLDQEQVRYIEKWAQILGDAKNYSEAISKILYDHETKTQAIENLKDRAKKLVESKPYQEVREIQIEQNEKDFRDKDAYQFLKEYQKAPIDKSKNMSDKRRYNRVNINQAVSRESR
jgi:hypothetical protein